MTDVTVNCLAAGTYGGIYDDFAIGVPIVTVSAVVPHPTLFGILGLGTATAEKCGDGQNASWICLTVGAQSQSAVFGA